MRIRTKFSLFTSLVVLITTMAIALVAYFLQKNLIEKNLEAARGTQANGFAAVCRQSVIVNNELFMINYIRLLQESDGIVYAYFTDSTGNIKVHTDKKFYYQPLSKWLAQKPPGAEEVSAPVRMTSSAEGGRVVLGFSRGSREKALDSALYQTLVRVALAAAAVAILGFLAAFFFAYILTRPLQILSSGSEEIAKGNFKTQVRIESGDELAELAQRFNLMAQSLALLDELKDELISDVSHDIRSPMSAIQMYLDLMLNTDKDKDVLLPKHRAWLNIIKDHALRQQIFVNNVLDAATMKAGRMKYHLEPVAVDAILKNVQSLYQIMAENDGIALNMQVSPSLPKIKVDPVHFERMIINLVSNALKFTKPGGKVTVGAKHSGNTLNIFVADTGKGIPKEELLLLFQRFRMIDGPENSSQTVKGTGLGLYITKEIARGMGGNISVESEPGKGSRFIIQMPLA